MKIVKLSNTLMLAGMVILAGCSKSNEDPQPPAEYTVAVATDGYGTAVSSIAKASAGTTATLTATPKSGYKFFRWVVTSRDVILSNATDNPTTFTMPDNNVSVKAEFVVIPTYAVTVTNNGNGSASSDVQRAAERTAVTLTATPKSGYKFAQWVVTSGNVTLSNVTGNPATFTMPGNEVSFAATFAIDISAIPNTFTAITDPAFLAYCQQFDTDDDGVLSPEETAAVTSIDITDASITDIVSLKGIELFTALKFLDCGNNRLTSLDLSANTVLESLICSNNSLLTNINLSNKLTSIDASGCTALRSLYCINGQLASLDLNGCTALTELICYNNKLTNLDLSGCIKLESLACNDNQLTSLDLSEFPNLGGRIFNCSNNKLTSLDLSGKQFLWIYCGNNQLTSLDVSGNNILTVLGCYDNQLESLDVSENTKLRGLDCGKNKLSSLDMSRNTELVSLSCDDNQLTSLDMHANTDLQWLECQDNLLTSLDISGCNTLRRIYCQNNPSLSTISVWSSFDITTPTNSIAQINKDAQSVFVPVP